MIPLWLLILLAVLITVVLHYLPEWLQKQENYEDSFDSGAAGKELMSRLTDTLKDLDRRRKSIRIISSVFNLFLLLGLALAVHTYFEGQNRLPFAMILIIFLGLYWIKQRFFKLRKLSVDFKHSVMQPLVRAIDQDLDYDPLDAVEPSEMADSEMLEFKEFLADEEEKSFDGEDLVSGEHNGVKIRFSDVEAFRGADKEVQLVFEGTFFMADFGRNFKTKAFVIPDFSKAGLFMEIVNSTASDKKKFEVDVPLIALEHEDFERVYDLHAGNEAVGRHLITDELSRILLTLDSSDKNKRLVSMSLIGSKLYLALMFNKLNFEPTLHQSMVKPERINFAYQEIKILLDLVDEIRQNENLFD